MLSRKTLLFVGAILLVIGLSGVDAFLMEGSLTATLFPDSEETAFQPKIFPEYIQSENLVLQDSPTSGFLKNAFAPERDIKEYVLLQGNDRTAFIAWLQDDNAPALFRAFKHAVSQMLSSETRDLRDTILEGNQHILTFLDPSISEERFLFLSASNEILEFHIAPGKEEDVWNLLKGWREAGEKE